MEQRSLKFSTWIFVVLIVTLPVSCNSLRSTGKNPSRKEAERFKQFANYKDKQFQNNEKSTFKISLRKVIKEIRNKPSSVAPPSPLPTIKTDLTKSFEKPTVIWFGHSSFMIKSKSGTILADPDFSDFAGPVSWMVKAFPSVNSYKAEDMPMIDALIISHDHFDHLDYSTILKLKGKVKRVVVPLGIGSHFIYWGYDPKSITELNWNQSAEVGPQLRITVTPSRHESKRKLFSSKKTLWGSFVIELDGYKLFYSGDTGYGTHFKTIGNTYGPFDLAVMECGQYNKQWPLNHMFPYQSAQAATDLEAKTIVPVHWGKFAESTHPWNESIQKLLPVADSLGIKVSIPKIGEPYTIDAAPKREVWWNF